MNREDDAVAGHLVERLAPEGHHGVADCPDDNVLAAFLEGRVEPRKQADLERHLVACEACRGVLTEALALRGGDRARQDAFAPRAARSHRRQVAFAAAALLVVATGVAIWASAPTTEAPAPDADSMLVASAASLRAVRADLFADFVPLSPAERAAMAPTRLRGGLSVLRPADIVLPRRPDVEWVAAPGATGYEVSLSADGGPPVWRQTVGTATSVPYPAGGPDLAAGGKYVVRVEARGPLGRTEATRRFAVAGERERALLAEGLREIDVRVAPALQHVLRAQFALRRGFLLEAERHLGERLAAEPGDAVAQGTLLYVRRRLGVPEP